MTRFITSLVVWNAENLSELSKHTFIPKVAFLKIYLETRHLMVFWFLQCDTTCHAQCSREMLKQHFTTVQHMCYLCTTFIQWLRVKTKYSALTLAWIQSKLRACFFQYFLKPQTLLVPVSNIRCHDTDCSTSKDKSIKKSSVYVCTVEDVE